MRGKKTEPARGGDQMWAALRNRSLSLSKSFSPGNQLGFQEPNQSLSSLSTVTAAVAGSNIVAFKSAATFAIKRRWRSSSTDSSGNRLGFQGLNQRLSSLSTVTGTNDGLLNLQDVEKVLTDVRADDVKVIPVGERCDWMDHMVIATGRSPWHVKNIAHAILYKAKEKQRKIGAKQMMLPSVQGQDTGKWVIIDSGKVIIHALDENARAYYDLEDLWTSKSSKSATVQDFQKAFVKVRRKNNSKKPVKTNA